MQAITNLCPNHLIKLLIKIGTILLDHINGFNYVRLKAVMQCKWTVLLHIKIENLTIYWLQTSAFFLIETLAYLEVVI